MSSATTAPQPAAGPALLGLEIGGTKLQIVVGDAAGRIGERRRFQVEPGRGAAGIRELLGAAVVELTAAHHPAAIGVGFGGPVDTRTGRSRCSHQIAGWSDFALGDWLQGLAGVPVRVDNDANVAAFGEARHGAGRGANPVFYVTLGSGVGGGLVVDGRIYHGAPPGESELGHVRLDRSGATVEARCSGWAVDARIRALVAAGTPGTLCRLAAAQPGGEARHLAAACREQDPAALGLLQEVAGDLAFGLSHVVQLMHPERVVLGGGLALVGEPLRAAVAAALPAWVMEVFHGGPPVVLAGLGEDSVPIGALALAHLGLIREN